MKIKEALEGATAKVERLGLTKWLVALVVGLILLLVFSLARATGVEHAVVIVTKVVPVVPATVTPAAATVVPAAAPVPATAPAQQPSYGGGSSAAGWFVFAGVGVFFYAVICSSERHRNPEGFFAKHCKPKWME
jgi:hypothetical protein